MVEHAQRELEQQERQATLTSTAGSSQTTASSVFYSGSRRSNVQKPWLKKRLVQPVLAANSLSGRRKITWQTPTTQTPIKTTDYWQSFLANLVANKSVVTTTLSPATLKRRTYSWQLITTTTPIHEGYSWQKHASQDSKEVTVRRYKAGHSIKTASQNRSRRYSEEKISPTRSLYLYQPITEEKPVTPKPISDPYIHYTTNSKLYRRKYKPVTSEPLSFVTSYQLPDYLRYESAQLPSNHNNFDTPYRRRLMPVYPLYVHGN